MRWLGVMAVAAGGLVCCGAAATSAGVDLNWGLAIGLPAAAGLFGVVLRIWPSNGSVPRKEHREDVETLHKRLTDETVSPRTCEVTHKAVEDRLKRLEQKLDKVLDYVGPKRR